MNEKNRQKTDCQSTNKVKDVNKKWRRNKEKEIKDGEINVFVMFVLGTQAGKLRCTVN